MKKEIILKNFVDVLLYVHYVIIVSILIYYVGSSLERGFDPYLYLDNLYFTTGTFIIIASFFYITFHLLKGLHSLRKVCNLLLSGDFFSDDFITKLQLSGRSFTIIGSILMIFSIISWISNLFSGIFEITYSFSLFMPAFTLIIGLFFSIQAKALKQAQGFKSENELTI
jgi:hypothetical protein